MIVANRKKDLDDLIRKNEPGGHIAYNTGEEAAYIMSETSRLSNLVIQEATFVNKDRESILQEAESLVHGARNETYGHPLDDFSRTATLFNTLASSNSPRLIAEDIALLLICVKLSRQSNLPKRDNLVDLAGYAETWQWCIDERERRELASETFCPLNKLEDMKKEIG